MIKAMVIDDEELTAEHICRLLKNYQTDVLGYYSNPLEALEKVSILKPDVLFLDIEMPEMNGLELAEKIHARGYECEIVFITAYNQYAIEAFSVNALDYLLKPVMVQDLNRSIERVKRRRAADLLRKATEGIKTIRISLFGKLRVYTSNENESIHWMTSKCAEVFAFMLLQKGEKEVSKWKLMEAIWPDKDKSKADINLRSTICRLNKTLREYDTGISMISTGNGYELDIKDMDLVVDAFELERLILGSGEINIENAEHYNKFILDCKDMLLEDFDSEWCDTLRIKYHRYFISTAKELADYYSAEPIKMLNIMELMVKHEPYDEYIRGSVLRLHYKLGGKQGAEQYYKAYKELLKKDLGIEPEASIKALYKNLIKA